ncbi:alpha-ketoglutarate-dependent dioxygenase AlkB family protein [Winogradskyella wichelsiae]|uniref:alpha-ketoglutarate-dependent dioxygenase AlkB family protein n=1 Tax=Winogradskyella wichelsiae TaxID=2697007 RepID=UPI0015C86853|nr:alpha-ketoglutarate-dependent dioxygenase AlkB [Winogradskyella wichelsiae]
MDLFPEEKQHFKLPNAELIYIPNYFSKKESNTFLKNIRQETEWQHDDITIFGKTYKQPRLTALFSETNLPYSYSNITMHPNQFTETLLTIKNKIEYISDNNFNTALINLYRDGNDSNGWHSDNEKELGLHPIIASVSFGQPRTFHFKHNNLKDQRYKLILKHGSVLIMKGEMQEHWKHQIAKTKKKIDERINVTFRTLIS